MNEAVSNLREESDLEMRCKGHLRGYLLAHSAIAMAT